MRPEEDVPGNRFSDFSRRFHLEHVRYHFLEREGDVRDRPKVRYLAVGVLCSCTALAAAPRVRPATQQLRADVFGTRLSDSVGGSQPNP